jgi:hypothetical protein
MTEKKYGINAHLGDIGDTAFSMQQTVKTEEKAAGHVPYAAR